MPPKALTALVFTLAGLLGLVIVVGLVRGDLDATGVALALSTVLSAMVTAALVRKDKTPPDDRQKDGANP